jgi:hypothetical protein
MCGQIHAPAALLQGVGRQVPNGWEAGWTLEPIWTILPGLELRHPSAVQPVPTALSQIVNKPVEGAFTQYGWWKFKNALA